MQTKDSRFLPNQQNLIEVNLTNADTYQLFAQCNRPFHF